MPGLREVTAEEFLQVNKGLMLAFHRDFVCGVPYGVDIWGLPGNVAFAFEPTEEGYYFQSEFDVGAAVIAESGNDVAVVTQGEVNLTGNFYDLKLFEVVE